MSKDPVAWMGLNGLSGYYNHYLINEELTLNTGNPSMTWPLYCLTINKGEI